LFVAFVIRVEDNTAFADWLKVLCKLTYPLFVTFKLFFELATAFFIISSDKLNFIILLILLTVLFLLLLIVLVELFVFDDDDDLFAIENEIVSCAESILFFK
jgi:hypothetical protein